MLEKGGLAVNVAASTGFNAIWQSVMGPSNRRPTEAEIEKMRGMITANLERGAYGVSSGLDYKPAYFATTDEVVRVVSAAGKWRTFFPNHDRSTPESGYSSKAGIEETITIGERAGLVPEITHMKIQGRQQGTAGPVLAEMASGGEARWVAADVYPYLAGQTGLAALIVPAWAQDGGIEQLRVRLKDSTLRARIIAESDEAIAARFNGAESILVGATRKLSDIMREQGAPTPGAAIAKIMETQSPMAILGFGIEADLIKILQYPSAAIACDCGAATGGRGHPRYYGNFPRVLGRYVRETHVLTWEDAVRKMSGLPAAIMGLVDRGFIAPGMAADVTVFDSATVIDHATFEQADLPSDGIRHVIVNGKLALTDGKPTGERGGAALRRTTHEPSRPMGLDRARSVKVSGRGKLDATIAIKQSPEERHASGTVKLTGPDGTKLEAVSLGLLQTGSNWASVSGIGRSGGELRAFTLVIEGADPFAGGSPTATVRIDGRPPITGRIGTPEIGAERR
jgi:N-acyl-D-aspartate/D-glutamate deacylase